MSRRQADTGITIRYADDHTLARLAELERENEALQEFVRLAREYLGNVDPTHWVAKRLREGVPEGRSVEFELAKCKSDNEALKIDLMQSNEANCDERRENEALRALLAEAVGWVEDESGNFYLAEQIRAALERRP